MAVALPDSYRGEEKGFPVETADFYKEWIGLRMVRVAWADRYNMIDYLMDHTAGYDNRRWPYCNINAYLAKTIIRGVDQQGKSDAFTGRGSASEYGASYVDALIQCEYRAMVPDGNGNLVGEQLRLGTSSSIRLNTDRLCWDGGRTPINFIPGDISLPVKGMIYTRTLYHQLSVPGAALDMCNGCNAGQYTSLSLGVKFNAETLLYHGCHAERAIKTSGLQLWTVAHTTEYRPYSWNMFFREETNAWEYIYNLSGQQVIPHPKVNFAL